MKKFYFTDASVQKSVSLIISKMNTDGVPSLEITSLTGSIHLPSGGNIGTQKAIVSLTSDKKLIISRDDKKNEAPYEYPLDHSILQWIKINKIPVHLKL